MALGINLATSRAVEKAVILQENVKNTKESDKPTV